MGCTVYSHLGLCHPIRSFAAPCGGISGSQALELLLEQPSAGLRLEPLDAPEPCLKARLDVPYSGQNRPDATNIRPILARFWHCEDDQQHCLFMIMNSHP